MAFYSLHTHSHYSRMDGMQTIQAMCERAKELGQTAIGLTDHGTVSGHAELYKEAKKHGIKPVLGIETYLCDQHKILSGDDYHLCLYAMNDEGLRDMYEMQSIACGAGFYRHPRVDMELLKKYGKNLIATTACMGGPLKRGEEYALALSEIFTGRFYVEIHTNTLEEQPLYNKAAVRFALEHNLPLLAAVDSHYARKEDAEVHRGWTSVGRDRSYYTTDDYYLMDEQDAARRLSYLGAVVSDAIARYATREAATLPRPTPTRTLFLRHQSKRSWAMQK